MSQVISRRSFLKYSAVAALAVAGSSMLSGCENGGGSIIINPNQPSGGIGKTLNVIGSHTLTEAKYDADAKTLSCKLEITCKQKAGLSVVPARFEIRVTNAAGTTTIHNTAKGSDLKLSEATNFLGKGETLKTTLTLALDDLAKADNVVLRFWPRPVSSVSDDTYQDIFATWKFTGAEAGVTE